MNKGQTPRHASELRSSLVKALKTLDTWAGAAAEPHNDDTQVDVGTFQISQGGRLVGELFVEEDPVNPRDTRFRIEHWALYGTYEAPGERASSTAMTLQFRFVASDQDGGYQSATNFREEMRRLLVDDPGLRYIQTRCQEMAP